MASENFPTTTKELREAWFDVQYSDLERYILPKVSMAADATRILIIVRSKIHFSRSKTLNTFLQWVKKRIDEQVRVDLLFQELFTKYQATMKSGVTSGLGSGPWNSAASIEYEEAESLSQEAWIALYRKLGSFEPRSEPETKAYVFRFGVHAGQKHRTRYFRRFALFKEAVAIDESAALSGLGSEDCDYRTIGHFDMSSHSFKGYATNCEDIASTTGEGIHDSEVNE